MRERIKLTARAIGRKSVMIAGTTWLVIVLLVLPAVGIGLLLSPLQSQIEEALDYTTVRGDVMSSNRILAIPLKGEIDGEPADAAAPEQGVVYGYTVAEQLEEAAEDDGIKAVVLVVDSPGGTIYGARAIAEAVESYREKTKRPVVVHVAGAADSGGYWVAASADLIVADYGTDIGGIGVISGPYRYYSGVTSLNDPYDGQVTAGSVASVNITAGVGKDFGDPYRKMTPEEQAIIQRGVDNDYAAFVDYVASRRHIPAETVRTKIGAYSYDPTSALALKLIDRIGGRNMAFRQAAERAHLKIDDYQVISPVSEVAETVSEGSEASSNSGAVNCHLKGRLAVIASTGCYNK